MSDFTLPPHLLLNGETMSDFTLPSHLRPAIVACALLIVGCGGSGSNGPAFEDSELAPAIVAAFADDVIIPTYEALAERLALLETSVQTLQADPTEANLEAAQQAWVSAREPWEASEGFLFGPVDGLGFDPALDSWPVDRTALDQVLASGDELTQAYVSSLDDTLQGFHTAEYLLFGTGNDNTAADLTGRELEYLAGVVAEMTDLGTELAAAWTDGVGGAAPYGDFIRTAGATDNTVYPSMQAAAQEIVYGSIGILDEVANGKIADPFGEQDVTLVESQFSWNSLEDFTDNIHSVRNAWLGINLQTGESSTSFADFVGDVDPDLAARVTSEIDAAIASLGAIPEPFRDSITDPAAADQITAAQDAIRVVQASYEAELQPFVTR
ncbi:MAG TPA: imelysin family protein [Myxococcota bacterium]|nr:imelysin family protein [Myxococcota bacterium]